jgi:processive 1,2-diacylglycerol beta-glucosyltransferase
MVVGSVLIVTTGFGEGHNAAARNLAAELTAAHPGMRVAVHDIFEESYGWIHRLLAWMYGFAINRLPWLWNLVFLAIHHTPVVGAGMWIFRRAGHHLRDTVRHLEADVVVSTYPGYGALVDLVWKGERPFEFVTVVTDSLTVNAVWHRCRCDHFLVPNDPTRAVMETAGVASGKIRVTGFPVPAAFAAPGPAREVPPADGLWRVLLMVNARPHEIPGMVRALLEVPGIALTVTCGRHQRLMEELQALAEEREVRIDLHGWTDQMPMLLRSHHLLVGKAGGAAVQESLAARTPMVVTHVVPGQEEGNAALLIDNGAGVLARGPADVATHVADIVAEDGKKWHAMHAATTALGHPAGAAETAHYVANLCR